MELKKFTESLVQIEFKEEMEGYGHYPFQMIAESPEGNLELNCLALNDVRLCYAKFATYYKKGYPKIYMSVDFPNVGDIRQDFVCIFSYENGVLKAMAIPYNNKNGELSPAIGNGLTIENLISDLKYFMQ